MTDHADVTSAQDISQDNGRDNGPANGRDTGHDNGRDVGHDNGHALVRDVRERHRYEISIDGETAGFTVYRDRPGGEGGGQRRVFVHTEISPRFEGQGFGSQLIREALNDVRVSGRRAVAVCPFVTAYLQQHREFDEIVDRATPAILSSL
jgi:predicted GNAT family acetyltransferase